jgi:hypothetical protein
MELLTDDQLMQGLNQCDKCGQIGKSEDLFWNFDWAEHSAKQLKVLTKMREYDYQAVCTHCFYTLIREA